MLSHGLSRPRQRNGPAHGRVRGVGNAARGVAARGHPVAPFGLRVLSHYSIDLAFPHHTNELAQCGEAARTTAAHPNTLLFSSLTSCLGPRLHCRELSRLQPVGQLLYAHGPPPPAGRENVQEPGQRGSAGRVSRRTLPGRPALLLPSSALPKQVRGRVAW